jgi:hypothetical protein
MRLLFPIVTAANYTQCINLIKDAPVNWVIDCVLVTKGYLALDSNQVTVIETLANQTFDLTEFIDVRESYKTIIAHDYIIPVWGEASSELFYGLTESAKLKTFSKTEIYHLASECGIDTPTIYSSPTMYPLLAKPINGTGSLGVKKIHDAQEYYNFFEAEHKKTSLMQVPRKSGFTPHDYFDLGKGYQIEEFIEGDVSTIVGCIIDGQVHLGYTYDIESNIDEYLTTTKAILPSRHHHKLSSFTSKIERLLNVMNINNTPFIIDVIVSNHKIYLIDFALRFGGNELTFNVCSDWMIRAIIAIKERSPLSTMTLNKTYIYQVLPFKKGVVIDFTIDRSLPDMIKEPSSKEFYTCKNLHSVIPRGYVLVSSDSIEEATIRLKTLLNTFKVIYE